MMNIYLNTQNFLLNNLTDEEVLYLLILSNNCSIERAKESLISKGYITQDGNLFSDYRITKEGADKLNKIILSSEKTMPNEDELYTLVDEMRALFPKGKKEGKWAWRGVRKDLYEWLKKWYKRYGTTVLDNGEQHTWTPSEILRATKQYVESFQPPYEKMRLLHYFIMKDPKLQDSDGVGYVQGVSDLAKMLENPEEVQDRNWLNNII